MNPSNKSRRLKVLTQEDLEPYITFTSHGQLHLIPKDKIRNLLDEPRKPNKEKQNPIDDIGQTIKEDISINKIIGNEPTKEVDITCNEASFCIYKFQNGSLCGCKFKDWCAYQTPQIDRKPTKEVPDIRPILEKLVRDSGSINWTEPLINQAIQEISALYRKEGSL